LVIVIPGVIRLCRLTWFDLNEQWAAIACFVVDCGPPKPVMSNPNGLLSQKVWHYLNQGAHWMAYYWGPHIAWLTLILAN